MTDTPLIQYPHQLSEAACDPIKACAIDGIYCWKGMPGKDIGYLYHAIFMLSDDPDLEPQDIGIETFAGDTLVGGLPDD